MSTAATVKHRHQTALANTGADVSATVWNDSLVIASAAADGAIFVKDSAQPDGWGLVTALPPVNGGTGLTTYAVGDLLYASGATTLAKLADVAVGSVLVSGGVGAPPVYSASPTLTSVLTPLIQTSAGALTLETISNSQLNFRVFGANRVGVDTVSVFSSTDGAINLGYSGLNRFGSAFLTTALVVGTNPATVGAVRLANGLTSGLYARNLVNLADIHLISLDNSDYVELANGGQTVLVGGSISAGGTVQAGAGSGFGWSGLTRLIATVDGKVQVFNNAQTIGVGLDATTNGTLKVRTTAQNADANLSALLLQTMTALIALGGGAAPTLGTIGGSGPAVAAQNTWLKMLDSAGVAFFVPAWK